MAGETMLDGSGKCSKGLGMVKEWSRWHFVWLKDQLEIYQWLELT